MGVLGNDGDPMPTDSEGRVTPPSAPPPGAGGTAQPLSARGPGEAMPHTYLAWAILSMLFCCAPLVGR